MKLDTVYARFFRSLNYDYIRGSSPEYDPEPWDATPSGAPYPFVRLRLDSDITTVVGGNESGKSQMLDAVVAALTGSGYERSDFCRYSPFFSVDKKLIKPEFGALFRDVTPDDMSIIGRMTAFKNLKSVERVALFRMNETPITRIYVRRGGVWSSPENVTTPTMLAELGVPAIYKIDADTPLPDSVPLEYLATGKAAATRGRQVMRSIWEAIGTNRKWFETSTAIQAKAEQIASALEKTDEPDAEDLKRFKLAADLLQKVAGLNQALFVELQEAVQTKNGYANSIVDTINSELAKSLNFPRWWSQDSHFELFVSLFEYDLVFMIRDRTGRSYGFDERSSGLKYFLSYFVQYLAHEDRADGQPEILLMDEPDQFLSSSGQQDLLRILASFASPEDGTKAPVQVLYVTHSPFLIDKNHAERIRVLEKGEHDEGTRVVASAAQNHYEPLRSAFGSFVGETTFIGNCNLMLEGPSDQVLLAGISSWLDQRGAPGLDRLDLNALTLVPAGSASQVPYLTYLARGRDVEQPAVIVLLDGDKAGHDARKILARGGARRKPLVDADLVLQLSDDDLAGLRIDNPAGRVTIEDLLPFEIGLEAVSAYCEEFVPDVEPFSLDLTAAKVYVNGKGMLSEFETAIATSTSDSGFHLDKIGFARSAVTVLAARVNEGDGDGPLDLATVEANFRLLFAELGKRQRKAIKAESQEKIRSRIKRTKTRFLSDRRGKAHREHVTLLIEEIANQLDNSYEAEEARATMRGWKAQFKLEEDPRSEIENFADLVAALDALTYQGVRQSAPMETRETATPSPNATAGEDTGSVVSNAP